jgi:hypothetical protein
MKRNPVTSARATKPTTTIFFIILPPLIEFALMINPPCEELMKKIYEDCEDLFYLEAWLIIWINVSSTSFATG